MPDVITNLFTWNLLVGLLIGWFGRRAYCHAKARWLNRHRPYPDGRKHRPPRANWRALAQLAAIALLLWSVYSITSQATRVDHVITDAHTFAVKVQQCQREFNAALKARSDLSIENDRLSLEQRNLLTEGVDAQNLWLRDLLTPVNPEIAGRDIDDPVRQKYGLDRTAAFFEQVRDIRGRIEALQDEQRRIETARRGHPLPEPTCGN